MDMYYNKEMWTLALPIIPYFWVHQPWIKGWQGEQAVDNVFITVSGVLEWAWVDQELKEDMGH